MAQRTVLRAGVVLTSTMAAITLPMAVPALAGNAVGGCTQSYTLYADDAVPGGPVAVAVADVVDTNGDGFICYKPYPNGDHHGHGGNLVDNNAAPHS